MVHNKISTNFVSDISECLDSPSQSVKWFGDQSLNFWKIIKLFWSLYGHFEVNGFLHGYLVWILRFLFQIYFDFLFQIIGVSFEKRFHVGGLNWQILDILVLQHINMQISYSNIKSPCISSISKHFLSVDLLFNAWIKIPFHSWEL